MNKCELRIQTNKQVVNKQTTGAKQTNKQTISKQVANKQATGTKQTSR